MPRTKTVLIFLCLGIAGLGSSSRGVLEAAPPEELVIESGVPQARRDSALTAARRFYEFWATGDEALLHRSLSPRFRDHTLPPGRPQGPTGPVAADRVLRTAVPDLQVTVRQQILAGDRVVSHLLFTGHFTGRFKDSHGKRIRGRGQTVRFLATDILRVQDGKITDNWHLEDNLTFLRQIGVLPR
ncbi:MAG: ester cyclase [Cytophagales bacterium]|nr:ester cyclase [Armatimonadota bacterium]